MSQPELLARQYPVIQVWQLSEASVRHSASFELYARLKGRSTHHTPALLRMDRTNSAFVVGAIAGAAVSSIGLYFLYTRQQNTVATPLAAPKTPSAKTAVPAASASLQDFEHDEILAEQLTRNVQFFGVEKQRSITSAFVVVIGLGVSCQPWMCALAAAVGSTCASCYYLHILAPSVPKNSNWLLFLLHVQGVGSHAAHLMLRSGVGRLRLVDFDQVTLSSLNRHAVATREDVGIPKATCLQKHFKQIMPEVSHST